MAETVSIIDITAQVTDNTAQGAASATQNVGRMEHAILRTKNTLDRMSKMSRIEVTAFLIDKASRGIDTVVRKGRQIAGRVWRVTVSVVDRVTAPIRGMISKIGKLIGIAGIASTVLGGLQLRSALQTSATNQWYSFMLSNVGSNVGVGQYSQDALRRQAQSLQGDTMIGATAFEASASELMRSFYDIYAIKGMQELLADVVTGRSGGARVDPATMAQYAGLVARAARGEVMGLARDNTQITEQQKKLLEDINTTEYQRLQILREIFPNMKVSVLRQGVIQQEGVRQGWLICLMTYQQPWAITCSPV